ncbi:MAG: putative toxin-antitoxin system toxin component, PIN family [Betaproteobacteria bacterium]|nr:putative toxin-antitoxin system toxin component, PIN family [Betaproteobacteria bacterium]
MNCARRQATQALGKRIVRRALQTAQQDVAGGIAPQLTVRARAMGLYTDEARVRQRRGVVCDTNVLVAALVAEGLCRDLVKRRLPAHDLFTSKALLDELTETLRRKFGVEPRDIPFLKAYRERAELVAPAKLEQPVCRDPDDDVVLAVAAVAESTLHSLGR